MLKERFVGNKMYQLSLKSQNNNEILLLLATIIRVRSIYLGNDHTIVKVQHFFRKQKKFKKKRKTI